MSRDAWSISTASILMGLRVLQTHKGIELDDLKYSILDPRIVYRNAQELSAMYTALPNESKSLPKGLVAFRPERLALHEIIVAVSTRLQVNDEDDMRQKVNFIYDELSNEIVLQAQELDHLRRGIENQVRFTLNEIEASAYEHANIPPQSYTKLLKDTYVKLKNAAQDLSQSDLTLNDAVIAVVTDKIYTEIATKKMNMLVNQGVTKLIEKKFVVEINIPRPENRLTLMVAGGQASGKGSSVAQLKYATLQQRIDWRDVSKINTDSYRSLLLKPGSVKPELYSQLSQEEASLVHQKVQQELIRLAKKGQAPHVFVDQVFVGKDKLDFAVLNDGSAKIIVVSTEVIDAVERSYQRGKKDGTCGRYEDTKGILRCHRTMTEHMLNTIAEFSGKNIELQVVDNNVAQGEQPIPIMQVDLVNKIVEVQDETKMQRFLKKTIINVEASSSEDVYLPIACVQLDDYFNPLINRGFSIELPPADPSVDRDVTLQLDDQPKYIT